MDHAIRQRNIPPLERAHLADPHSGQQRQQHAKFAIVGVLLQIVYQLLLLGHCQHADLPLLAARRNDFDLRHQTARLLADIGKDRAQYAQRVVYRLGRQSLIASGGALPQQQLHILLHQQRRQLLRIARPDMGDDVMENDVAVFGIGRWLDPVPADGEPFLAVAGKGRLLSAFYI